MKIGIIGLGAIAHLHIKAINAVKGLKLHSVCRRNKGELDKFCTEYNVRGFTNYKELLEERVDIAVIALPHTLHYKVGMEALAYGCHLVMEKPFAVSMTQCRDLYLKAKERNLKIITTDSVYHLPKVKKAREIVKSGKLGRFISGSIINYKDYFTPDRPKWFLQPELSGGGQLINVGVHRIALIRSIVGNGETVVRASIGFFEPGCKVEGNGLIFIGYKDGSAVVIEEIGYYKPRPKLDKCCHFNFENGVITLSDRLNIVYKNGNIEYPQVRIGQDDNPYFAYYKELIAAIKKDKDPYPGAKEGIMDVRIILAAYESAKSDREIRLDTRKWKVSW